MTNAKFFWPGQPFEIPVDDTTAWFEYRIDSGVRTVDGAAVAWTLRQIVGEFRSEVPMPIDIANQGLAFMNGLVKFDVPLRNRPGRRASGQGYLQGLWINGVWRFRGLESSGPFEVTSEVSDFYFVVEAKL